MGDRRAGRRSVEDRGPAPAGRGRPDGTSALSVENRFRNEAKGTCPLYERLIERIVEDDAILDLLRPLPPSRHQPNLFFASVNYLGGIRSDYEEFRAFVLKRADEVVDLVRTRRTQTNEVGRCAVLLPALPPGPLALVEVGASAGLNLLLDRYGYDYGAAGQVGDGRVVLHCEPHGLLPVPDRVPEVVWRKGVDIAPVDVRDDEAVRWLEACVFAEDTDRLETLRAAVRLAREDPPEIVEGDLVETIEGVLDEAPRDATTIVFHSAVLPYVDHEKRQGFEEIMGRRDVVWLSNEVGGLVSGVRWTDQAPTELCFFLGRNGSELLAYSHPHGRWVEWVQKLG